MSDEKPDGGKPKPVSDSASTPAEPAAGTSAHSPAGAAAGAAGSAAADPTKPGGATPAGSAPAADAPTTMSWLNRPLVIGGGVAAAVVVLLAVVAGPRVAGMFTLPECNDEAPRKALNDYFVQKNVKLTRLGEVKPLSSTRSERTCTARADAQGRTLYLDYRIHWNGWDEAVTITRSDAEARIEPELLGDIRNAAKDFLDLAKDSTTNGRPPRYTEPTIATLLDRIFDLSEIDGATLAVSDITRANEWFATGDRVGTVYILAGTGVADINRLPSEASVQRRTHRNVAEFSAEFARYLDFQVRLAGMMMDAQLKRMASAGKDTLDQPQVMREIADVRTTITETLTGDLTTLAYEGLTDDWRRARLAVMMQVVPKAATFLSPEQVRAVRDRALTVVTFVRDKSVQDQVKVLADAFVVK